MYSLPERLEVLVLQGVFGWEPVLGLKVKQLPQEIDGIFIQPRGVKTEGLGSVGGEVSLGKLLVLSDPRPAFLSRSTKDLWIWEE